MPTGLWEWLDDYDAVRSEMDAWRDFNAQQDLADLLPGPILVENDGTAACWAEWAFGDQSEKPDSIYFFIGTFVGGYCVEWSRVPGVSRQCRRFWSSPGARSARRIAPD